MATQCKHCPLRNRALFAPMTQREVATMEAFKVGELVVDPKTPLMLEGSNSPQLYTVLHGMGLRYKTLPDGKRQIVNFVMPGDFIGLQASVMGEMGHSVEATTKMVLCVFNREAFWDFFKDNPKRAYDVTWLAATEEHFLGDALATVGQRSAIEAVAWALCKIYLRGQKLGLVSNGQMRLPYKQQDLADALGLSVVHTNKMLARLKSRQLAHWTDDTLSISDIEELADVALLTDLEVRVRPLL